jgi:starvation-inducible DNA-binding protein
MLAHSVEKSMMEKSDNPTLLSAPPDFRQDALEIQAYATGNHVLPPALEEPLREEMTECLNHLLAKTIRLRELYKKSTCQVAGPTFHEIHLLFDKHNELQILGEQLVNVSIVEA